MLRERVLYLYCPERKIKDVKVKEKTKLELQKKPKFKEVKEDQQQSHSDWKAGLLVNNASGSLCDSLN